MSHRRRVVSRENLAQLGSNLRSSGTEKYRTLRRSGCGGSWRAVLRRSGGTAAAQSLGAAERGGGGALGLGGALVDGKGA
jgi:hypothetical protein